MNPNFCLDFRNDQIKLLHLQEGFWVQIGAVAVDDPDLEAALGYLRSTAIGLSPRGLASKLILPDAAVLYTTLTNLSPDAQTRASQIADALVGRTPYDVGDLVYDWADDGASAHLAVIARETLDEAEAFATQHRFNPVAFAAWPENGQREADFGRSAHAPQVDDLAPEPEPLNPQTPLTAHDFEMGDTATDVNGDAFAAELVDSAAVDETATTTQIAPEPLMADDMGSVLTPLDFPDPAPVSAELDAVSKAAPTQDDLFETPQQKTVESAQLGFDTAEASVPMSFDADLPDADLPDAVMPEPPLVKEPPEVFAPTPSEDPKTADAAPIDEAPMALDVPIEDSIGEDPKQVSAPTLGPSAGKAQTLLAEFAARREVALGKSDSLGRVEPVLSVGNAAKSVSEMHMEAVPKFAAVAPQPAPRAKEQGLGSRPSVKRPAQKARGRNSALLGFVLTILLLIALAAAAAMSSYLTAAWNSYGTTTWAAVEPSAVDNVVEDLATRTPPLGQVPQTVDLAVPNALTDPVTLPVPKLAQDSTNSLVPLATPALLPQPLVVAPPNITTTAAETAPTAPLITPTAQGVMTPEGVFLIAGRPSTLPLARPDTVVSAALQRPAIADITAADTAANPALAGKKPLIRPEGLTPSGAMASDPALAGKRPLSRPDSVLAAGNAAMIARASLVQPELDAPRSAMAVAISRLPAPRPKGLKTTIAVPQDLALATPEQVLPEIAVPDVITPEASAPLEADNEPEVVASKSSGPRTVVSKNATYKNAINLSKVNLIGIYGSQANRYALVRQANGRFKKIYVGDRFDGGLVAAITESELRYSKGGQMLALQMPKG